MTEAFTTGDVVQVTDRKSGYGGCVLTYIRSERPWLICLNNTCPTMSAEYGGRIVGAIRVRSAILLRKLAA